MVRARDTAINQPNSTILRLSRLTGYIVTLPYYVDEDYTQQNLESLNLSLKEATEVSE